MDVIEKEAKNHIPKATRIEVVRLLNEEKQSRSSVAKLLKLSERTINRITKAAKEATYKLDRGHIQTLPDPLLLA